MARDSFFSAAAKDSDKQKTQKSRPQAPVVGLIDGVGDSLSEENERLKSQIASGAVLLNLDPSTIDDGLVSDRVPIADDDEEFQNLVASIRSRGQDQPVVVRPKRGGEGHELIAGRRRLRACRVIGIPVIARVQDLDDRDALAVMWSENNLRLNPSPMELASWIVAVRDRFAMGPKDLREITGFGASYVSELTKIGEGIPAEIREAFNDVRKISKAAALDLVGRLSDKKIRAAVADKLDQIRGLNSTEKQIAAIVRISSAPSAASVRPVKRDILSGDGRKRGSIARTSKGVRIELLDDLSDEQIEKIEAVLREI